MAVLETATRNAMANAIDDQVNAGAGAGTLVMETSGDVEVATLTFSTTAFGAASTGTITAASITDDTSATGGTVAQASIYDSDSNKVIEMTVSTSGADINMSSLVVAASETISCSALTITVPAS